MLRGRGQFNREACDSRHTPRYRTVNYTGRLDQPGYWRFHVGGAVVTNPIAFSTEGGDRIAIASGYAIFVFGL